LQAIGTAPWCAVSFANISKAGKFIAIAGRVSTTTTAAIISTGATAQARATVVAGRISEFKIWEPGSGYTSAPVMTITDPNNSSEVSTSVRIGNGVIANPTITNSGIGYQTTNTRATITGNGYKDQYQLGSFLVCDAVTRLPGPGDNLSIAGINDYTYKVLSYVLLAGSVGSYTLQLNIAKDLGREETPEHGIGIEIRQAYSQVRLTGHDFLDIGTGSFTETNYPGIPTQPAIQANETADLNGGRVFYTSTDQDGNFRVGGLFNVEQSTGVATLNADAFNIAGLNELSLGSVALGGSGATITEFSTDPFFTQDSDSVIPTQRAIKAYITSQIGGGGSSLNVNTLTAGVIYVAGQTITTTTNVQININTKVNFKGGIAGNALVLNYFLLNN
jgi:hypothetical protein